MSCFVSTVNQSTADPRCPSFAFAPEPEALRIVRTVLFSLIASLALVGNYVIWRAVWRNPGAKPIAHYLVSNLAFAEIVSMVCLVFTFHAYEPPWSWELGHVMCKIVEPVQIASLLVITTTLAILAVYRCVLLVKPLIDKPSHRQTCCVILICWMGSLGLSFPAGYFRVVNSYGDNCETQVCEESFPEGFEHYKDVYSIILFVINFALPLVIMSISYALVGKKIREHIFVIKRLRNEQNKAFSSVAPNSTCIEEIQVTKDETIELANIAVEKEMANKKPQGKKRDAKREIDESISHSENISTKNSKETFELENDLLRMVYALVLIFVVCYIPYQVQFLFIEFNVDAFMCWPHRYNFGRLVFTLTCLPSALHPVFYGMMSKFYRKAFIKLIACRNFQ